MHARVAASVSSLARPSWYEGSPKLVTPVSFIAALCSVSSSNRPIGRLVALIDRPTRFSSRYRIGNDDRDLGMVGTLRSPPQRSCLKLLRTTRINPLSNAKRFRDYVRSTV